MANNKNSSMSFILMPESEKRKRCPIPEPQQPWKDWTWYTLFLPVLIAGFGVMCFAVLAYSFTEVRDALANGWSTRLVVAGAIAMAIGGEFGTGFTILEVFRKHTKGETSIWDWVGLLISFTASTMSLFLSWAWLSGIMATWTETMQVYGPLILGFSGVADFYAGWMEAGLYKGTYEERVQEWEVTHYIPWREYVGKRMGLMEKDEKAIESVEENQQTSEIEEVELRPKVEPIPEPKQEPVLLPTQVQSNGSSGRVRAHSNNKKPGKYDEYVSRHQDGSYMACCPWCDWAKGYGSKRGAVGGIAGHMGKCSASHSERVTEQTQIELVHPLQDQVVDAANFEDGDF